MELLAWTDALVSPATWAWIKAVAAVAGLVVFWTWESWRPVFPAGRRVRHAARNLSLALFNTVMLALLFGTATVLLTETTAQASWGLLHWWNPPAWLGLIVAVLVLDAWMYCWHRANHEVPFLWRFHRMHHHDPEMDVTTATRFHPGEHLIGASLRLLLIPLFGLAIWQILIYESLVIVVTQWHHANISLGRWDRPIRTVLVTPAMHKVHHSHLRHETNSNYASVFSFWDRIARSYRRRADVRTLRLGLDEFGDPRWQSLAGMVLTPIVQPPPAESGESTASGDQSANATTGTD